jgi:putative membrane-bound dehydrogenase-like protein
MRQLFAIVAVLSVAGTVVAQAPGLTAPPGFEVTEYAGPALANDICCMTVDARGRPVVAGRGYIRVLVDDDGDGKADRAIDFAHEPKDGAMGLLWEGDTLFATGDGGLRRFRDKDGDGRADGPSELIRKIKTGGEHTAHAIRRGPDGWLYVLCGNTAGIDRSYAQLPTSPVKEPVAGCVLRFTPDLRKSEIVAHGYRNPYGMDFNPDGELFTYDSDNERCVSLPWYEHTRLYHVIDGGFYGWLAPQRASFWRMPPYFFDVVPPLATLGRGSPTGVACYRHVQFPEEYRGGLFLCDWTFGKVYYTPLERAGSTYRATPKVFLASTGDNGFAPTAVVVQPQTGDLFVSIGGRGTRGGVYRVRYPKGVRPGIAAEAEKLQPAPRSLVWSEDFNRKLLDRAKGTAVERLWTLKMIRRLASEHFLELRDALHEAVLWNAEASDSVDRGVRLAWAELFGDVMSRGSPQSIPGWLARDRGGIVEFRKLLDSHRTQVIARALRIARQADEGQARLDAIRILQLSLGDLVSAKAIGSVWEGYTARKDVTDQAISKELAPLFPSGDANLDRELTRTLAMIGHGDAALLVRLLDKLSGGSDPVEDIHYLIVFARLDGPRTAKQTERVAAALLDLDRKIEARSLNRDTNWPLRVRELYAGLAAKDAGLHAALVARPEFGRPDHALFTQAAGFPKRRAAGVFLERIKADGDYRLTPAVVALLAELPPADVLPVVRKRWGETGQEAAMLPLLARDPRPGDRAKFLDGLATLQGPALRDVLAALAKLGGRDDGREALALFVCLRRLPDGQKELRSAVLDRLQAVTGEKLGADHRAWVDWFARRHPQLARRLTNPDGVDTAAWEKRLAGVAWSDGEPGRGRKVFERASCVNCHSGTNAVGPDLTGVAGRFSRGDLFTAIVQPSRDVPARYQTTVAETRDGKLYQGVVIYDATDSLILQTGAATTVRLPGQDVVSRRPAPTSLMPAGLLDALPDRDLADLYAYLRTLGKGP